MPEEKENLVSKKSKTRDFLPIKASHLLIIPLSYYFYALYSIFLQWHIIDTTSPSGIFGSRNDG